MSGRAAKAARRAWSTRPWSSSKRPDVSVDVARALYHAERELRGGRTYGRPGTPAPPFGPVARYFGRASRAADATGRRGGVR